MPAQLAASSGLSKSISVFGKAGEPQSTVEHSEPVQKVVFVELVSEKTATMRHTTVKATAAILAGRIPEVSHRALLGSSFDGRYSVAARHLGVRAVDGSQGCVAPLLPWSRKRCAASGTGAPSTSSASSVSTTACRYQSSGSGCRVSGCLLHGRVPPVGSPVTRSWSATDRTRSPLARHPLTFHS